MKLISAVEWVAKGVAAARPQKVKLDKNDMQQLLTGTVPESSDVGDEDDTPKPQSSGGLRGSQPESEQDEDEKDPSSSKKESKPKAKKGSKTKEEGAVEQASDHASDSDSDPENQAAAPLKVDDSKGVGAMFASPEDDPYIQEHGDSSEEDDDYQIGNDDNLLITAKIIKDHYDLLVWVYNAQSRDFYVHHSYMLEAPPICLCTIRFDPGSSTGTGNLCAVGTMDNVIDVWDLDIVNAVQPMLSLGEKEDQPKLKKRRKKDKLDTAAAASKCTGHSDAVLSIKWNRLLEHILVSGSADHSIILWDIENAKANTQFCQHSDKVQTLDWHPVESNLFVSGGCDGALVLWDGREPASTAAKHQWTLKHDEVASEIECAIWNVHNPYMIYASTNQDQILMYDSRKGTHSPSLFVQKHSSADVKETGAVPVLCQHPNLPNALISLGETDQLVKIWQLAENGEQLKLLADYSPSVGNLHSAAFCPDSAHVLAVAGEQGDYVQLCDLTTIETVKEAFGL